MARRETARNNLLGFVTYTMPQYRVIAAHRMICERLEAVERGECKRLMVLMPPRHGKSQLVSRHFPAWYLGRNPQKEFISASYGADLASDFGRDVRNILATPEFAAVFPGNGLAADSTAKDRWHTRHGGGYVAAGIGTAITGRGADILNIDDPVKDRAAAESEVTRKATLDWYRSTAYTRLMPGGSVVVTMTRWHEEDLGGTLLEEAKNGGDQWEVLCLPALANAANDPLGRSVNEALWPDRYPAESLQAIRSAIGERDFGALYQQEPRPSGTSFFNIDNALVDGQPVEAPTWCESVFCVIDTAVKTGAKHDGTGVIYFAYSPRATPPLVVLDWDIQQISGDLLDVWLKSVFDNLEILAKRHRARMGSGGAWIEDKSSGMVLIQQAERHRWPAQAIPSPLTAVGKDERAISVSGYVHRGDVKVCRQAFDRIETYKGRSGNQLLMQVFRFQLGVKDQQDDLLDCWCYGIALSLGNADGF